MLMVVLPVCPEKNYAPPAATQANAANIFAISFGI
jgi:hypothetical protein